MQRQALFRSAAMEFVQQEPARSARGTSRGMYVITSVSFSLDEFLVADWFLTAQPRVRQRETALRKNKTRLIIWQFLIADGSWLMTIFCSLPFFKVLNNFMVTR